MRFHLEYMILSGEHSSDKHVMALYSFVSLPTSTRVLCHLFLTIFLSEAQLVVVPSNGVLRLPNQHLYDSILVVEKGWHGHNAGPFAKTVKDTISVAPSNAFGYQINASCLA